MDEVLNCLDGPLLVINEALQILNANPKALEILDSPSGQTDFGRFIIGDTPSRSQEMRRRIQAALSPGGRVVLLLRHPRHRRLVCSVKTVCPPHSGERYGLTTLLPLGEPNPARVPFLRDIYKLSKTEAEIALCAAAGAEVAQIAMDRHVSIHTLRAQIASIKIKMGLTRMTEIAVTVARINITASLI